MPSFIIHSIVGKKLINKLNLTEEEKESFFIGNLLPDSQSIEINSEWDEREKRKNVQLEKKITHFRDGNNASLEYPNPERFLNKYEEITKINIITLGYFFHLYTDYYYFKFFLPKQVEFLDKEGNESFIKEDTVNVKLNKTNKILDKQIFWSKIKKEGLYQEYSRLNKYLIKKYNFDCDCTKLLKYIDMNNLDAQIEEIDSNNCRQVIEKLDWILENNKKEFDTTLTIFEPKKVDNFINEVIDTFTKNYKNILNNYK